MPHKVPAPSEDDQKLLARLKKHPKLFARVEELLAVVENAAGDIEKASVAEALVILEVRKVRHESLSSWASNQAEKVSEAACGNPKLRCAGKKISWHSTFGAIEVEEPQFRDGTKRYRPFAQSAEVTNRGYSLPLQRVVTDFVRTIRFIRCQKRSRSIMESTWQRVPSAELRKGMHALFSSNHNSIGRLKERSRGSAQHYRIDLQTDETGKTVTALTWQYCPVEGTQATHPGVYCQRSNALNWDTEQLWRTYSMLTDLEAVFRSLKDELGLRPIYHHRSDRTDGHLFITVLAYQLVHLIRTQLKAKGIDDSWNSLRGKLTTQRRVTARFRQRDGFTLHVRKSTEAEPEARATYEALELDATPGGTRKLIR